MSGSGLGYNGPTGSGEVAPGCGRRGEQHLVQKESASRFFVDHWGPRGAALSGVHLSRGLSHPVLPELLLNLQKVFALLPDVGSLRG